MCRLTIVICTRNRAFILPEVLGSLAVQTASPAAFGVLVVDNGSSDDTEAVVRPFLRLYSHFGYVREERLGLSYARNRGYLASSSEWVGYLDDDARVPTGFVERALRVIQQYNFDSFGGWYSAWYKYGKPRWLPWDFGTKPLLLETTGELKEGFLSGSSLFLRRSVLVSLSGFSTDLGMKGSLGYGEEDELQLRMRENGYRIGFDPLLKMEHGVLPEKLKLSWHIRSAYSRGRDGEAVHRKSTLRDVFGGLARSLVAIPLKKLPLSIIRMLGNSSYFWQNAVLDSLIPIAIHLGRLVAVWRRLKQYFLNSSSRKPNL